MPFPQGPQSIAVNPAQVTSSIDNTVTSIRINGYGQFDPFNGVTAQVVLFNAANQIIKPVQVRITGTDWQNWPVNQTEAQDNAYAQNVILTKLGLTAKA